MKSLRYLVLALLFVGTLSASSYGQPFNHQDLAALSTKSFYPISNAVDNNCLQMHKQATILVQLSLGEDYDFGKNVFSTSAKFDVLLYENEGGGVPFLSRTDEELALNEAGPESWLNLKLPVQDANKVRRVEVVIKEYTADAMVQNAIQLDVQFEEEVKVDVNTPPYDLQPLVTLSTVDGNTNPVNFQWTAACTGAPAYELQVMRVYNEETLTMADEENIYFTVNWGEAVSVLTESSDLSQALTIVEGTGFYLWRVRPIGSFYAGGYANPKNWGEWSESPVDGLYLGLSKIALPGAYAFFYTQFDDDKNMIYSRVFTEGNRVAEGLTYANGLLYATQSQAKQSSAEDTLFVGQSLYDFSGRAAGGSMTVPTNQQGFGYKNKVLTKDALGLELYTPDEYDADVTEDTPDPILGGLVQGYYSDNNPDPNVPDAQGYAFSRTKYLNDGTGRPREQGGVGPDHKIGSDHSTTISYEPVSDTELVRIFGDEAPKAETTFRVVTKDANGVVSYQYVDNSGKTLATALLDNGFNNTLDHLESRLEGSTDITQTIIVGNNGNDVESITKEFFVATNNVMFQYNLTPSQYALDCGYQFCSTCDYAIRVEIRNMETLDLVYEKDTVLLPQDCEGPIADMVFSFSHNFDPGRYQITRFLDKEQVTAGESSSIKAQKIQEAKDGLSQRIYDHLYGVGGGENLFGHLEAEDLTSFYNGIGVDYENAVHGSTVNYNVDCLQLEIPIEKCEDLTCADISLDFEAMLYAAYPNLGAEANDFFFTNAQPTFPPQRELRFTLDLLNNASSGILTRLYVTTRHGNIDLLKQNSAVEFTGTNYQDIADAINGQTNKHHYDAQVNGTYNGIILFPEIGAFTDPDGKLEMETSTPNDLGGTFDPFINTQSAIYPGGKGAFNALIQNMVNDGYSCTELYHCWQGIVTSFGALAEYDEGIENDDVNNPMFLLPPGDLQLDLNYGVNLLQTFLNCTGYQLEGISDCPYGDCDGLAGDEGFLDNAHKYFYYVAGTSDACEEHVLDQESESFLDWLQTPSVWPAGDPVWHDFKQCVESQNNYENNPNFPAITDEGTLELPEECLEGGPMSLECAQAFQTEVQDQCMELCDVRYKSFIQALAYYYLDQGYTVQLNQDDEGIFQVTYGDLECESQLLIESCEQLCSLSIVYDGGNIVGIGTPQEIDEMKKVFYYNIELLLPDGQGNCGAGYDLSANSVEQSNVALGHLKNDLELVLTGQGNDPTCWDYNSALLDNYLVTEIMSCSNNTISSCNPGITVVAGAENEFYTTTADNYEAQIDAFIEELNDAVEAGVDVTVKVPYGIPFLDQAAVCRYVGATTPSTIFLDFGATGLSLTANLYDENNTLMNCFSFLSTSSEIGEFSRGVSNVLEYTVDGTTIPSCVKFCAANSCVINFRQYQTCDDIAQQFVDVLNNYTTLGGVIPVEDLPLGLMLPDQQGIPTKATALYPNGITLSLLDETATEIILCPSSIPNAIEIEGEGQFVLDQGNGTMYYHVIGDDYTPVTCLTPHCQSAFGEIDYSGFSCMVTCKQSDCDPICFKWVEPLQFTATPLDPTSCEGYVTKDLLINLYAQIENGIAQEIGKLNDSWNASCPKPSESFTMDYSEGIHHYTLFYYDRSGKVIRTVPPAGVDHTATSRTDHNAHAMVTEYEYNSFGQLVQEVTVDGGTTMMYYDDLGRVRFSQDAQQQLDNTFNYVKYDQLGRPVESGLSDLPGGLVQVLEENANDPTFPDGPTYTLTERTITVFDNPVAQDDLVYGTQRYLRNRVSYNYVDWDGDLATLDDQFTNIYSYDAHGNVEWVKKDIAGLGEARIAYEYDIVSGNVLKVKYNEGREDAFYHRYSYDEDNRVVCTETSTDNVMWEKDARYNYYAHGSVKRQLIGEDKVQGIDHVHTIHGWTKAINHTELGTTSDPGQDGVNGNVAKDAFGMVLGFYEGDFVRTGSKFNSGNGETSAHLSPTTKNGGSTRNQYNGNIATWTSNVLNTSSQATGITGQQFEYDEIGRLTESNFNSYNGTWSPTADYFSKYSYDANGNIKTLQRNGYGTTQSMDDFTYHYVVGTNRLQHIDDVVNSANYTTDLDDQSSNNYIYDAAGRLTADIGEGILSIKWNSNSKVEQVTKDLGAPGIEIIEFEYDAMGHRASKTVTHPDQSRTTTLYVRDASGMIMATYKREDTKPAGGMYNTTYSLAEQPIYAGSRVGQRIGTSTWSLVGILAGSLPELTDANASYEYVVEHDAELMEMGVPFGVEVQDDGDPNTPWTPGDYSDIKIGNLTFEQGAGQKGTQFYEYSGEAPTNIAQAKDQTGSTIITYFSTNDHEGNAENIVLDKLGQIMSGSTGIYGVTDSYSTIIKVPGDNNLHHLITVRIGTLYRHTIDMDEIGNGTIFDPAGAVIEKNISIGSIGANQYGMAVLEDRDNEEALLYVKRKSDSNDETFIDAYRITTSGIQPEGKLYQFGYDQEIGRDDVQISPDGKYLAVAHNDLNSNAHGIRVFDINTDGSLTLNQTFIDWSSNRRVSSFDFAPVDESGSGEVEYLYFTWLDMQGSNHELRKYALGTGTDSYVTSLNSEDAAVRRGMDGKIYMAVKDDSRLTVIDDPNGTATVGNLVIGSLIFPPKLSGGLPLQNHIKGSNLQDKVVAEIITRKIGYKQYELSDHLGNVRAVVSDIKLSTASATQTPHDFVPEVLAYNNYYPFGMEMPGRIGNSDAYRYGFNGMEKDDELKGSGNSYSTEFRLYDPRVTRWLSLDPLAAGFPDWSDYNYSLNNPILFVDRNGKAPTLSEAVEQFLETAETVDNVITIIEEVRDAYELFDNAKKAYELTKGIRPVVRFGLGAIMVIPVEYQVIAVGMKWAGYGITYAQEGGNAANEFKDEYEELVPETLLDVALSPIPKVRAAKDLVINVRRLRKALKGMRTATSNKDRIAWLLYARDLLHTTSWILDDMDELDVTRKIKQEYIQPIIDEVEATLDLFYEADPDLRKVEEEYYAPKPQSQARQDLEKMGEDIKEFFDEEDQ